MKREVEESKKAKIQVEETRRKLLDQKKRKQEEMFRLEQEKRERKQKKKLMEDRWAMARWISQYIDENCDRWKIERDQRKETEKERAERWKKMERLEKIKVIKEKMEEDKANKTLKVKLKNPKLVTNGTTQAQAEQHHSPVDLKVNQADQSDQGGQPQEVPVPIQHQAEP